MTANIQIDTFSNIPGFQGCSDSTLQRICDEGKILSFDIGHSLSTSSFVPDRVLILLNGKARLLAYDNGELCSLGIINPGSLIGLCSLLRAEGCEEISAAANLEAWSIPDTLIAEIYASEPTFRNWCNSTVFPAEVVKILQHIINNCEQSPYRVQEVLGEIFPLIKSIRHDKCTNNMSDYSIFIASNNSNAAINTLISKDVELPNKNSPFDLRLLQLPSEIVQKLEEGKTAQTIVNSDDKSNNSSDSTFPSKTRLQLDGKNAEDLLTLVKGEGEVKEVIACFRMISEAMNLPFRSDAVEKSIRDVLGRGMKPSLPMLGQMLTGMGLLATRAKVRPTFCTRMNVPCLMEWIDGLVVVVKSDSNGLLLANPRKGWQQISPEMISGNMPEGLDVILVDRTSNTQSAKFSFSWFYPAIKKYRSALILVLSSSFVVQLFSLANPLLIQVIIDKVISQRSLDTLQVLGIALVAVTIFEGLLSSLRTFLFTDTTNRIDMRLGAEVIDHLLKLPVNYFDRRPVGELGTRVAELEKIRNFLTGEALTTLIDAAFSVIYILVMAVYSWVLTVVALIVVPIQVAITLAGAPLFRKQFRLTAEENAKTQSHLVEVLTGIQTVKAQNVEIVSRWKWQELYSSYISRSFQKTITGTALSQTGQVLQKLSQLMVLWVGSILVLNGELTLGQLIAFRIISGYVTQPLLRLSTIWQRIQELRVSFERLADIVDTSEESNDIDKEKIPLPPIQGEVTFNNVQFRFNPHEPKVLKDIDLTIPTGKFVGVVGQSGSGKSTLMKLIPRLYSPEEGKILIDGYDIDKVELYSLRRQIGIVPQDPLLFSGSVSNNIALTNPNATSDDIATAAKISCAHDFIMGLPSGYSTELGERGANLSGGQRQRVAIARTLLAKPKLLVMDEATSALDYDTERRVCQNLRESLSGCTVFFVTHRLSTVRNADLIVMMHQGAIVEIGTHDELIQAQGRYYALFRQQEAG